MTDTALASLRPHVLAISALFRGPSARRLDALLPAYSRWQRQLVRVCGCTDLETLSAAVLGGEALMGGIESLHRKQAVAGIASARAAFKGIEAVLEVLPLSPLGQEPAPDALLDVPTTGLLARLWQRAEKRCRAVSPVAKPGPRKISAPQVNRGARQAKCVPSRTPALKLAA